MEDNIQYRRSHLLDAKSRAGFHSMHIKCRNTSVSQYHHFGRNMIRLMRVMRFIRNIRDTPLKCVLMQAWKSFVARFYFSVLFESFILYGWQEIQQKNGCIKHPGLGLMCARMAGKAQERRRGPAGCWSIRSRDHSGGYWLAGNKRARRPFTPRSAPPAFSANIL